MDPRHLVSDELEHEFLLRGLDIHGPNSIERLIFAIRQEAEGNAAPPVTGERATRNNVTQELQECERKYVEIKQAIAHAEQSANDHLADRGQSRIMHLVGRVSRLQQRAPEHSAVQRLKLKVLELGDHADSVRDSLGAGQQASEGATGGEAVDDALLLLGQHTDVRDVMPRTLPSQQQRTSITTGLMQLSAPPTNANLGQLPKHTTPPRFTLPIHQDEETWRAMFANPTHQLEPNVRGFFHHANPVNQSIAPTANPHSRQTVQSGQQQERSAGNQQPIPGPANPPGPPRNPFGSQHPNAYIADQGPLNQQQNDLGHLGGNGLAGGHNIHKWSLRFDGSSNGLDAADFIFRSASATLRGGAEGAGHRSWGVVDGEGSSMVLDIPAPDTKRQLDRVPAGVHATVCTAPRFRLRDPGQDGESMATAGRVVQ